MQEKLSPEDTKLMSSDQRRSLDDEAAYLQSHVEACKPVWGAKTFNCDVIPESIVNERETFFEIDELLIRGTLINSISKNDRKNELYISSDGRLIDVVTSSLKNDRFSKMTYVDYTFAVAKYDAYQSVKKIVSILKEDQTRRESRPQQTKIPPG